MSTIAISIIRKIKRYFALLLLTLLPFSIALKAHSSSGAENFVQGVANKALGIISSPSSNATTVSQLNNLFESSVNITWIARFILGKHYQQFSPEEFAEFQRLYKRYILRKYIPRFKEFAGYESKINYSKPLGQNYYLVQTKVFDPSKAKPLTVEYRVKTASNNKFYIHDISVDGISLILTHRSEFTNYLHANTVRDLMNKLENKTF